MARRAAERRVKPRDEDHFTGVETLMVKPEWGTKRTCPKCSTRFYDLTNDNPVHCIECGTEWVPEPVLKSKQPMAFEPAARRQGAGAGRRACGRGSGGRRGCGDQRRRGSRPRDRRQRSRRRDTGRRRGQLVRGLGVRRCRTPRCRTDLAVIAGCGHGRAEFRGESMTLTTIGQAPHRAAQQ